MSERNRPIHSSEEHFERYFRPRKIHVGDATGQYVSIPPYGEPNSDRPLVLAPGFTATLTSYEGTFRALAKKGVHTVGITHSRERGGLLHPIQRRSDMVVAVSQQVADVAQVPVDIAGHSFGGIDMTNAIKGNPELFNSAIFVCSAGIGRHSLRNFTFDVVRGFRVSQEALAGPYARQGIREGEHYLADDIPLALAEVIALSRTEIQHDIKTLKHAGGTVFIAAEHDSFFPPEKMRTELEKAGVRHDGFIEVPGAYHIFFAMNPEVASDVVLEALGKVKRRKKSTH